MAWVYLDNNATTQPLPEVASAVAEAMEELWANPSSVHRFGQTVRQRLELARQSVATLINCKPRELVFTSGGTESNNLAIFGTGPKLLVTTPIEHSAIREPAEEFAKQGGEVVRLRVDRQGLIDPRELHEVLQTRATGDGVVLVSVQWANNETGVLQPMTDVVAAVAEARSAINARGERTKVYLHVDATQAVGKLPVDVMKMGIDLLTLAAHKFHGPKGVGALFVRTAVRLRAVQRGGPQEREKRGGTENVPAILGMGVAAEAAMRFVADQTAVSGITAMRDRFERAILKELPDTVVNSGEAPRLWNTSNLGFPGLEAEAILLALSERSVCASAGAACSSGSLEPSPVLLAMGIPEPVAHGSVRFSLSRLTTDAEVDEAIRVVPEVVRRLRQTMPMGV